ncbi:unnamed protein product [Paramecium pentaurelia]|uniref:Cyclic nucleotide-binding domain-containing protein n=1 Tax=Paramecium pentaurelia TaxID=43138 RepID=A0A8S1X7J6_9CILI|nr:unnamed protein product [Paramecium pentaurelia]
MNFDQINSEPDEPNLDTIQNKEKFKQSPKELIKKRNKRNALSDYNKLQQFNEQLIVERQIQNRGSMLSFFLKNIYVKRFLNRLLLRKKIKQQYQQEIFNLIDDKSAYYTTISNRIQQFPSLLNLDFFQNVTNLMEKKVYFVIKKYISIIPIIQPENYAKITFDVIGTTARLYFLYLIPVDLAWAQYAFLFQSLSFITIIMITILIAEFLFNLNVAYYQEGNMVTDRKQIAKNLISKSYGLEIFSTIILILALIFPDIQTQKQDSTPQNLIFLLFLVHKVNIDRIVTVYETAINLSKKFSSYLTLVKLLMFFFYVVHVFACLWYWVGKYNKNNPENWLYRAEILDDSWDQQYLVSFYYACVTMFTVGYGDLTPKTQIERVVTILFIILSSVQLPYSVNTVGNIIQQISAYGEERKNKLRTINSYMQRKNVPYTLQNQIRQYLDYYWQLQASEESEDEKQIIQQLPENLRDTLMIKANHSFFNKVSLFKDNFSIAFKQKLLKKINHLVLQPGQIIEIPDEKQDCPTLFYIEEGTIEVFLNQKHKQCIRKVNKQQALGIDNFIVGTITTEIFKSIGLSKLLILQRNDFINVLSQFPEDFETFCKLKDDILFNQDLQLFEYNCIACGMNSHKVVHCPFIHYAPQKDFIIKKFNYYKNQKRRDHLRSNNKTKRYFQLSELNFLKKQISIISNKITTPHLVQNKQQQKSLTQSKNLLSNPHVKSNSQQKPLDMQPLRLIDYGEKPMIIYNLRGNTQNTCRINQKSNTKILFINAVKKVIAIQRWFGRNDLSMIDRFETSFDCKLIRELIVDLKRAKEVNQKDLDSIEMLLIKTKNLNKYERKRMDQFELAREFKVYFSSFNLSKIVERLNFTKYQKYYIRKLQKLLPYLKYPGNFIKQYKVKLKHKKLKRSHNNNVLLN